MRSKSEMQRPSRFATSVTIAAVMAARVIGPAAMIVGGVVLLADFVHRKLAANK